uniref:Uncharacterized protein n=1 Tax=Angiostrongylus cantonensis TaxID=6313 RepID=A0A0K0DFU5_ANGCA
MKFAGELEDTWILGWPVSNGCAFPITIFIHFSFEQSSSMVVVCFEHDDAYENYSEFLQVFSSPHTGGRR